MDIPISDFEVETLDKIIHTHTFSEYHNLESALHNLVGGEKEKLIREGKTTEHDFAAFQTKSEHDILQFLLHNEFIWEREGGVHFLTQRGEDLRKQGTLQKYLDWRQQREVTMVEELHTIETRGYLDKDQVAVHEEVQQLKKEVKRDPFNKYIPYYILIIVIIIVLCWVGRSHLFN